MNPFFAEIVPLLGDADTIYFCPDGIYHRINLETLVQPDGSYLSERYRFRRVSNTNQVIESNRREEDLSYINNPVLMGFPDYSLTPDERLQNVPRSGNDSFRITLPDTIEFTSRQSRNGLTDLPGALKELEDIEKLFLNRGIHAQVFTGHLASEENIKQVEHPGVLHISSHGFFFENANVQRDILFGQQQNQVEFLQNPLLRSGIYLAGAEHPLQSGEDYERLDDGVLTALEVQNIDLMGCELVVLSACDTGLGDVINGEGVFGLQRSFMKAGAEAVLMSLWPVNDLATQQMMTEMYHFLLEGFPPREALEMAKQELMKFHPEAYYWGAFVLIE